MPNIQYIRKDFKKLCLNCMYKIDIKEPNNIIEGCTLFTNKYPPDFTSIYEYTHIARQDPKKCGPSGFFYIEKDFITLLRKKNK